MKTERREEERGQNGKKTGVGDRKENVNFFESIIF
jgi:hypothetical protein